VLREDPSGKNAKPKKPSSAGLSFHIPLFTKSTKAASSTTPASSSTPSK
jgi:hypothetical protein